MPSSGTSRSNVGQQSCCLHSRNLLNPPPCAPSSSSYSSTEFPDFCGIAVEFIRSGSNEKLYTRAAGRVGVAADVVEKAIVALARVLVDAAKAKLDPFSLGLAISALDTVLSEEACRSLTAVRPPSSLPSSAPGLLSARLS